MTYLITNHNLKDNSIVPLAQFNNKWAVKKHDNSSSIIANSCLHRGALMVREPQPYMGNLTCPLHKWTYDSSGNLMGEPFEKATGCLETFNTYNWNNLLFSKSIGNINIPDHLQSYFCLDNYVHTRTETMIVKSSWQIFMEVYLDLYHVEPYHPGLGNFVDMKKCHWYFGDNWSIQEAMLNKSGKTNPNKDFDTLNRIVRENYPDIEHGALWMTIYPNIMLEWYPNALEVSSIWPTDNPNESLNIIEHHHLDSVTAFDKEFVDIQISAYNNIAKEDAEICELLQAGRNKDTSYYPTHPTLEKGIQKFYEYLNNNNYSKMFKIKQFE